MPLLLCSVLSILKKQQKSLRLYSDKFGTCFIRSIFIWESSFRNKILGSCSCSDVIFYYVVNGERTRPTKISLMVILKQSFIDKFVRDKVFVLKDDF